MGGRATHHTGPAPCAELVCQCAALIFQGDYYFDVLAGFHLNVVAGADLAVGGGLVMYFFCIGGGAVAVFDLLAAIVTDGFGKSVAGLGGDGLFGITFEIPWDATRLTR